MNSSNILSTFDKSEIKEIIKEIIEKKFDEELNEYDFNKCTQLSKDLSQIIKDEMKKLNYQQYKYVIQVIIGQCQNDNLIMTCRCLWDIQKDNYVSYIYSNTNIFCAVNVFGLFYY